MLLAESPFPFVASFCALESLFAAEELYRFLKTIHFTSDLFQDRKFTRLAQLEYLIAQRRLSPDLFWVQQQEAIIQ